MWSKGKKRSKLGRFLDKEGYSQTKLSEITKINKNTISKICNDSNYVPSGTTIKKIMKALRKLDSKLKPDDFFDI
ncbi:helix-turn-helix domain-containing protein [Priestia megaterium]|uniref:helix-turn-helix domain-containing protein n=1 Tax=Priestia megaterium TaxID=1404 RepID=UPI00203BE64F|nr:helix-turn-helix transcriptional regulator [Priestia megaterium]MCM3186800.1 helix-turn-helix transcriptional regulator [Priestia megaterium]